MAAPVETTVHPLRPAGTRCRERTDRASRALFARITEFGQSGSHDIQKPPRAATAPVGAGRRGAAAEKISAPRASPAAFRRTNTALPWRSDTDSA